ncbi:hypothetical protein ACI782_12855 [Geodermatophilus sp. SYSU D00703]
MSYGVLARALARLRPRQQENEATEALAYVLTASPRASRAFTALLISVDPRLVGVGDLAWRTQQRDRQTNAQADLVGLDAADEIQVIVEVKLVAELHGDQLTSYLDSFRTGSGTLVLLVPQARQDVIWQAAKRRLDDRRLEEAGPAGSDYVFRTLDGHVVGLVTWSALLQALERSIDVSDRLLHADLERLHGLLAYTEATSFRPLHPAELADLEWPRRWNDYCAFVDRVIDKLLAEGRQPSFRRPSSGRRMRVMGTSGWYGGWFVSTAVWGHFCISAEYWLATGQGPFFVDFQPGNRTSPYVEEAFGVLLRADPPRAFKAADGRIFLPIDPPVDADEDEVVRVLADGVEAVVAVATAGIPATTSIDEPPAEVEDEPMGTG